VPVVGVDVYVTNKAVDGKTLRRVGPASRCGRGVFLRKITRGATATTIPILPNTKIERGDILTLVGPHTGHQRPAPKCWASPIARPDVADVAFIGAGKSCSGALVGAGGHQGERGAP